MVNDTMIRHSPETGYPVTEIRRRGRVQARPVGTPPQDPIHRTLLRWLLNGVAGAFFLGAVAWLGLGVAGHVRGWTAGNDASAAIAALEEQWASAVPSAQVSPTPASVALPASAAIDFAPSAGPRQVWGRLFVPRLGLKDAPLHQGTESEQIDVGIGHYTATELPWQAGGNMGLAGHRTGWDQLFHRLDELSTGDTVYVETREAFFEYTITASVGVEPTDTWVLSDEPGSITATSGDSQLLTMTTCDGPNNEMRYVVWGEMTAVYDKSSGAIPAVFSA